MATIGDEIEVWKTEYLNGDNVTKYVMHTLLLMQEFKIEQEMKWLNEHPELEVSREKFEKALSH